jgi:hypothetical protein
MRFWAVWAVALIVLACLYADKHSIHFTGLKKFFTVLWFGN